jgi:hypothetical protein
MQETDILTKLKCSPWAVRRLAEGKHSDLLFQPLISRIGEGKQKAWKAVAR